MVIGIYFSTVRVFDENVTDVTRCQVVRGKYLSQSTKIKSK